MNRPAASLFLALSLCTGAGVRAQAPAAPEPGSPAEVSPPQPAAPDAVAAARPAIFVVEPRIIGMAGAVAATVQASMAHTVSVEGLTVMSSDEAKTLLAHAGDVANLGGDADGASLAELGRAVGAPHVLAAVVSALGEDMLIQMRLIEVAQSRVLARREVKASAFAGSLTAAVEAATRLALQPLAAALQGTVSIRVSEEGANVLIDDEQVGVSPLNQTLTLPGGHHLLTVTKEGFIKHQETFRITQGSTLSQAVTLNPSLEFMSAYRARNSLYRTVAWSTAAPAALSVAATGVFAVLAVNQNAETTRLRTAWQKRIDNEGIDEFNPLFQQSQQEIANAQNAATRYFAGTVISGGVAVVLGAVSGYFWLFGDNPERYAEFEGTAPAK